MQFSITFNTNESSEEIEFVAKLNNTVLDTWTASKGIKHLAFQIEDTDHDTVQCISIEMSGKTDQHTELDDQGNILYDHYTVIKNITFDDIDVTDQYCEGNPCYTHGNKVDEFYGFIGVNGIVCFEFSTPLWKWFLSKCK